MIDDILVIGAGSIGKRHIQCLHELGVDRISVCDPNPASRDFVASMFRIKKSYSDLDESLKSAYRAVIIAAPNHLHAEISCKVIQKKMDVMIEKPIEIQIEAGRRIVEAVEENGVVCLLGYCLRFEPGLMEIRRLLEEGKLGKIYSVDAYSGGYLPGWRPGTDYRNTYSAKAEWGGGVCLDISHEFDYLRWLFGEVKEAFAIVRKLSNLEINVEDVAECILSTDKEIVGRVHLDYLTMIPRRIITIDGSKAAVRYNFEAKELEIKYGDEEFKRVVRYNPERNLIYRNQLKHFFECIENRQEPLITAQDALKTLELALRIRGYFKK